MQFLQEKKINKEKKTQNEQKTVSSLSGTSLLLLFVSSVAAHSPYSGLTFLIPLLPIRFLYRIPGEAAKRPLEAVAFQSLQSPEAQLRCIRKNCISVTEAKKFSDTEST